MGLSKPGTLGLSQSEIAAYLSLLKFNPANGSQLSRHSGIPRANIYDVLRSLRDKGMVIELDGGLFSPLPTDEFLKRLRLRFDAEWSALKKKIEVADETRSTDYVWTIRGYDEVMAKSLEMIGSARRELYVLFYPEEARHLDSALLEAVERGVEVKYVSMGPPQTRFELQIVHPDTEKILASHRGRVFDVVRDKIELLVGMFEPGREDESPISWAKNHWFVMGTREGIRHDFFHYFLHKTLECGEKLSSREKKLYELIKNDAWAEEKPD